MLRSQAPRTRTDSGIREEGGMMTKYVTVTLTELEAGAVIVACINTSMDIGETPGDQYQRAMQRAEIKIRKARGEKVR